MTSLPAAPHRIVSSPAELSSSPLTSPLSTPHAQRARTISFSSAQSHRRGSTGPQRQNSTFNGFSLQQPDLQLSRHPLLGLLLQSQKEDAETAFAPPDSPVRRGSFATLRRPSSGSRSGVPQRRASVAALVTPHMRFDRLIGNSNPRYEWEQYRKSPEELKGMKKKIRKFYERTNSLIDRYIYVDGILDSTLPHDLLETYQEDQVHVNPRVNAHSMNSTSLPESNDVDSRPDNKKKRRPSYLYRIADEESPLLGDEGGSGGGESHARIVKIAIYVNLAANTVLLIAKLLVALLSSSLSVVASLVDGALDFLSTAIVWTTTRLMERKDQSRYPIGRSRLEPLGVLIFSVIMVTSFIQVGIEGVNRLSSSSHIVVHLRPVAIGIMASTVIIKGACYFWCRLIRNSSVQALAADALTDVVFNFFSILFPLLGSFTNQWWLDPLGGLLLSVYIIFQWGRVAKQNIEHLSGVEAGMDDTNTLLYLTMRFARSVKRITHIKAYHVGDRYNVEVDVVLDGGLTLKDSHDLGESLQFVLESLVVVDRAFVHLDYDETNPPGHLR